MIVPSLAASSCIELGAHEVVALVVARAARAAVAEVVGVVDRFRAPGT